MSDRQSPVGMFFEIQRDTLKQTGEVVERFVELSAEVGESVEQGLEIQREMQAETIELARESTHQSLDTVEVVTDAIEQATDSSGPIVDTTQSTGQTESAGEGVEGVRETIDGTFDSMLEQHAELFATVEGQHESVSEDALDILERQVDELVELTDHIETHVVEQAEQFVEQAEKTDGLSVTFEEQLEQWTEEFEAQTARFDAVEEEFTTIEIEA